MKAKGDGGDSSTVDNCRALVELLVSKILLAIFPESLDKTVA